MRRKELPTVTPSRCHGTQTARHVNKERKGPFEGPLVWVPWVLSNLGQIRRRSFLELASFRVLAWQEGRSRSGGVRLEYWLCLGGRVWFGGFGLEFGMWGDLEVLQSKLTHTYVWLGPPVVPF